MSNPIKILFLASDPSNMARLRLQDEHREIQDKLENKDRFDLDERFAARPDDLIQKINDIKPQIVHFAGHGTEKGELCLQNDQGETQAIPPHFLANLFELVAGQVKCVVLNSCFSQEQAEAIAKHVPFVIGMKKAITDKAAITFATGFYSAIASEQTIDNIIEDIEVAFKRACLSIQMNSKPSELSTEESTPILIYGDPRSRFRSQVEQIKAKLEQPKSVSATIYLKALQEKGKSMGLSPDEIDAITSDIIRDIQQSKEKFAQYEKIYQDALKKEWPVLEESETKKALEYYQKELMLTDKDVESIEKKVTSDQRWRSHTAFFDRGIASLDLAEYEKATAYFDQAIERHPNYSGAYLERGYTYFKLNEKQKAFDDYTKAIEINDYWDGRSLSTAYFERGYVAFDLVNTNNKVETMELAIQDFTKTIDLRPNYSAAYSNRALAYSGLERWTEAIADYTKALEVNAGWGTLTPPQVLYRRSSLYSKIGESQLSEQDAKTALQMLAENPKYLSQLGLANNFSNLDTNFTQLLEELGLSSLSNEERNDEAENINNEEDKESDDSED